MSTSAPRQRSAIVTGAAKNIGRATALALAKAGFDVVAHSGSNLEAVGQTVELVTQTGRRAEAVTGDLTGPETVARLTAAARGLGQTSVLVNNAAVRRAVPFQQMDLPEWRAIMSINLDAAFTMCRAVLDDMLANQWGRIINIGGLTGHVGAAHRAHVVASKAGLVGLTKALAVEFADSGVTVNCVVPGEIETERGASAGAPGLHPGKGLPPVGHRGHPEDVAAMIAHLCGSQSSYLTGQTFHVNGGRYLP